MTDMVIISKHPKGFWQADLYRDAWDIPANEFEAMGLSPDDFFTLKRGESRIAAVYRAREKWPGAKIDGAPILGSQTAPMPILTELDIAALCGGSYGRRR